jgi:hypothetical protein
MALFSECMVKYAPRSLDTADIVRDACLRQLNQWAAPELDTQDLRAMMESFLEVTA